MFHIGHSNVFKQAKEKYPHVQIVAGVSGTEETNRLKGKTIMTGEERAAMVGQNKWVHKVIYPCPWSITPEFLVQNNIHMVAHDDLPYACINTNNNDEDESSGDI